MAQLKYYDGSGYIPVLNLPNATSSNAGVIRVQNNLTTTETGMALDATQGKILQDQIDNRMGFTNTSSLITSGTIATSGFSYTASQNCIIYMTLTAQANSSLTLNGTINGVSILSYTSGEAVNVEVFVLPIILQAGDSFVLSSSNNKTGTYKVFALKS